MRLADYVFDFLEKHNIKHVFTVTGRGILYLTDALARNPNIIPICVHNEQAGSYAAMAYSQINGEIGVQLVSTGCASTNAITGCMCAWQDEVPCFFISGQNRSTETVSYTNAPVRTFGQQELDIVPLVSSITKYAVTVFDHTKIAYDLEKAWYLSHEGRKGPVWIDIPLDIQNMPVEPDELEHFIVDDTNTCDCDDESLALALSSIYSELEKSQRPIILIGDRVRSDDAICELASFVEKNYIPVVYDSSAVDIYKSDNELSIGEVASLGANRCANFAIQNSDYVLILGSHLSSVTTGEEFDWFARDAKITVVDIDENELKKHTIRCDKFIKANLKSLLSKLSSFEPIVKKNSWGAKCQHFKEIFPKCPIDRKESLPLDMYAVLDSLSSHLKGDAIVVCDAGLEELLTPSTVSFNKNQRCLHPVSQGAMGYALPAGIGAYLSSQGKQTVVVTGDGSVMMNLQELQTVIHNKIPLKLVVINNNCYAVIRKRQKDLFRTRTVGTDIDNGVSCPNYEKVAKAFGLEYASVKTLDEMSARKDVFTNDKAVLIEIFTTDNQTFLHNSFGKNSKGRFVKKPLEDQSPFMDRELFYKEMIVKPLD